MLRTVVAAAIAATLLQSGVRAGKTSTGIAYDVRGSGPVIVLLTGSNLDRRMWDREAAWLSKTHTVVRYDLRAHGQSDTVTAPFSMLGDLIGLMARGADGLDHLLAGAVGQLGRLALRLRDGRDQGARKRARCRRNGQSAHGQPPARVSGSRSGDGSPRRTWSQGQPGDRAVERAAQAPDGRRYHPHQERRAPSQRRARPSATSVSPSERPARAIIRSLRP